MTGTGEAWALAESAIVAGVTGEVWRVLVSRLKTNSECEAFRVALLLQGKDTRSARMAITMRRDEIQRLRSTKRKYRGGKHSGR